MKREVIIDKIKYISMVLFSYSTEHLAKKDKIRFYYALKGRDGKTGIVKGCKINQLGRAVLMVQEEFSQEVRDFLKLWACKVDEKEVLLKK